MSEHPIRKLEGLHALLEQRLRDEQRKRPSNSFTIQALKRRKLQVKDELARAGWALLPPDAEVLGEFEPLPLVV